MRLISARIQGYGRIVDSKVNLDSKVIAVVGPNEAGKTTFLKALAHIDSSEPVPVPQRSRGADTTDETSTTSLEFALEDVDHNALTDLDLHAMPQRATITRPASGGRPTVGLKPKAVKSVALLKAAAEHFEKALALDSLDDLIDPETIYADPESDAARDYSVELQTVLAAIRAAADEPGADLDDEIVETIESLRDGTAQTDETSATELREMYSRVIEWSESEDPAQAARDRIWRAAPDFIMFDEDDRSIRSSYTFDDALLTDIPPALANLASTADLDLHQLRETIKNGDIARRQTAISKANKRMDAIFAGAWKQSSLSVNFQIDGDQLRIELMEDGGNVTVFDERSAGLRMFVALVAFLKVRASERPPVLLIDEAENHLHIDAQADLVNMFMTQQYAVKVIYTTHSPACLPPDLGTSIRVVVPSDENQQKSDVRNSFWQGGAGYSPLMLAMGAGAAAFTPARFVVLAEGATEMIMLPSLVRSATGLESLPYQVAPGLSEVPNDFMPRLDLEAAHVAYLVDGDDGGAALKAALMGAGVPASLIVELGVPGIENLIEPSEYQAAIAALLPEVNSEASIDPTSIPLLKPVRGVSVAKEMEKWVKEQGLTAPSKVAVANWLVENSKALPGGDSESALTRLHEALCVSLGCDLGSSHAGSAS